MIIPVNDLSKKEVEIYSLSLESQIKANPGLFIAESPNVILRALLAGYELQSLLIEERYLNHPVDEISNNNLWVSVNEVLNHAKNIPIYLASLDDISSICGFRQSHGFLAAFKRKELPSVKEVISNASRIAVLESIQNPTNVGSIFRSAAALGMDAILLNDNSSDPLYRRSVRVSMGGVFQLPWTFTEVKEEIQCLKQGGFSIASMALSEKSVSLGDTKLNQEKKLAILFGNEQHGLSKQSLEASDYIVTIPMYHEMDSLNVASSSAIAFYQLAKKAHR